METVEFPSLEKSTIKKEVKAVVASCCAPKVEQTVCCTPSTSSEENGGACCAQRESVPIKGIFYGINFLYPPN